MTVLRRSWLVIGLTVTAVFVGGTVSLADGHGEDMVSRQLGNDLFATGGDVRLAEEIYGDAIAAGGEVALNGTVRGDALVAGGRLALGGTVDEDLYASGGEVRVTGHIAGSTRLAGGEIELDRDSVIDGGASIAGGHVSVDGRLGQYVQIAAGSVRINGQVAGDVEAAGGELSVGPQAVIEGSLTFRGPEPPEVAAGAQIRGGVKHIEEKHDARILRRMLGTLALVWLIGWIIVGSVLLAVWPGFARSVSDAATQRFGLSLLTGFLVLVAVPALIVLLTISLVGIPLGLLLLCLYLVLLPLGYLATAGAIGDWLLPRLRKGAAIATRHRVLMLLGVLIALFVATRLPVVGGIIGLLVMLTGMGALLLAAVGRYRGNGGAAARPAS
jgi:cytoskeletal protein CcmA (bactofilin family)